MGATADGPQGTVRGAAVSLADELLGAFAQLARAPPPVRKRKATHLGRGRAVTQQPREVLVFEVGGQCYALGAGDVRELVRAVALTPLPRAPAVVEGVINLRGRPVPVLDVRRPFRLPSRSLEPTDHFIVVRTGDRLLALRVDRALDLVRLGEAVEQGESLLPGVAYIARVTGFPRGLVLIHDLQAFLSATESEELAASLPPASATEGRQP